MPEITREFVRKLRWDLSTGRGLRLSQRVFARLIGVSWRTVARWEGGDQPCPGHAKKLERLRGAIDALGDAIRPESRFTFFDEGHPLLSGMRPIDLLTTRESYEVLLDYIEGAKTGSFA